MKNISFENSFYIFDNYTRSNIINIINENIVYEKKSVWFTVFSSFELMSHTFEYDKYCFYFWKYNFSFCKYWLPNLL